MWKSRNGVKYGMEPVIIATRIDLLMVEIMTGERAIRRFADRAD